MEYTHLRPIYCDQLPVHYFIITIDVHFFTTPMHIYIGETQWINTQ